MQNIQFGFDLYISLSKGIYTEYVDAILDTYPEAHLFGFDNRGRDIGPFLEIMQRLGPLNYKFLCKLHTKKSLYFDSGSHWRSDLLGKLLGDIDDADNTVDSIISKFESDHKLGILAPKGYWLPLQSHSGSNQPTMAKLMQRLGYQVSSEGNFVAGSMFWFRPEALASLGTLKLSLADFPPERGQRDGTLAHAFERLFSQIAEQNGYFVTEL